MLVVTPRRHRGSNLRWQPTAAYAMMSRRG
jgi:hypothetical protein